jgi:hypothetical protein
MIEQLARAIVISHHACKTLTCTEEEEEEDTAQPAGSLAQLLLQYLRYDLPGSWIVELTENAAEVSWTRIQTL